MKIDFNKMGNGLVPAIIQDAVTDKVLMLGFMNEEAFRYLPCLSNTRTLPHRLKG